MVVDCSEFLQQEFVAFLDICDPILGLQLEEHLLWKDTLDDFLEVPRGRLVLVKYQVQANEHKIVLVLEPELVVSDLD